MAVDPALEALLTPEGRALVDRLTPYAPGTALAQLEAVRRDPAWRDRPEVVAAAATQARLRTRAAVRFPGPARWWTADGLEQATRPEVSALHAQRFAAAGIDRVADLGSGAGSDALAMAERGVAVEAVDLDPGALWALAATASDRGLSVRSTLADVTSAPAWWNAHSGSDPTRGCFVDPARRRGGRRLLDPQQWSPAWSWVRALAERVPATGAKVAPGIAHEQLPTATQAEWISLGGDLVECGVWWGPLRHGPAHRVAAVAVREAMPTVRWERMDDTAGVPPPAIGPLGHWLIEPDAAVIRAGLVSVLAEQHGGHLIDPRIAYVLTDTEPEKTPFGTVFEVLDEVPFGRKPLRSYLRAAGYSDVIVKKRGLAIVPEELRSGLGLRGDGPTATLVLTRTDAGPLALLVRRTCDPAA